MIPIAVTAPNYLDVGILLEGVQRRLASRFGRRMPGEAVHHDDLALTLQRYGDPFRIALTPCVVIDSDVERIGIGDALVEGNDRDIRLFRLVDDAVEGGRRVGVHRDHGNIGPNHVANVGDLLTYVGAGLLHHELAGLAGRLVNLELFLRASDHLIAPFRAEIAVRQTYRHVRAAGGKRHTPPPEHAGRRAARCQRPQKLPPIHMNLPILTLRYRVADDCL